MQQTCNLDSTPSNRELKILDVCHIKEELTEVESVNAAHIKSEFGQTVKSINTESIDSEGFDSSNGAKLVRKRKFGCPFCKKLVRDISCHIRRCHVKEEEVQRALSKSTTSVERKRLLTMMRIRGMKAVGITQESRTDHVRCLFCGDSVFQFQDHCLKTHSSEPEVERIVHSKDDEASKRRKFRALRDRCLRIPQTTKVKCIHCGLLHSKRTLVKHIKNCSFRDKSETLDLRTVRKSCMTVTIHDSLDPRYRCLSVILGNTRQDDVTQIILNDRYLLELGKALIEMDIAAGKTPSDRLILKLRCLAKFLQTANKISSDALKSFRDVYIVSNYKYFKSSVIFMGDYVAETRSFSKPTLPLYVGSLVLHSSSALRSILMEEGDMAAAQEVIRWKKLYRRDFSKSIKKLINKDLEFDHRYFLSYDDSVTVKESSDTSSNESDSSEIKITSISTLSTEDSSNCNQIKEEQISNSCDIESRDSGTKEITGTDAKRFGCPFCKKVINKFARHLTRHHMDEPEVLQAYAKSTGAAERRRLLFVLKVRGMKASGLFRDAYVVNVRCIFCGISVDHFQGHCERMHSGKPEVAEILNGKEELRAQKFRILKDRCTQISGGSHKVSCPHCNVFYSEFYVKRHINKCPALPKPDGSSPVNSHQNHSLDSEYQCLEEILNHLEQDVRLIILDDIHLLRLSKALLEADTDNAKNLSEKFKFLATLLHTAIEISKGIVTSFKELFLISNYKYFKSAAISTGNYVAETRLFNEPRVPYAMRELMLYASLAIRSMLVAEGDESSAREVIRWRKLYRRDFVGSVGNALNKQAASLEEPKLKSPVNKGSRIKQFGCPYCKEKTRRFARHIQRFHSDEHEVQRLYAKTTSSEERKRMFLVLKNRGFKALDIMRSKQIIFVKCLYCGIEITQFFSHCKTEHSNEPEVAAILNLKGPKSLKDKRFEELRKRCIRIPYCSRKEKCPHCYRSYSKSTLTKHTKICPFRNGDNMFNNSQFIKCADMDFKYGYLKEIFLSKYEPNIFNRVENDVHYLDVCFAMMIAYNVTSKDAPSPKLSARLRALAKVWHQVTVISKDTVKSFTQLFMAKNFKYFKRCIVNLAGFDAKERLLKRSIAHRLGNLIMQASCTLRRILLAERDYVGAREISRWRRLYRKEFRGFVRGLIKENESAQEPDSLIKDLKGTESKLNGCPFCKKIIDRFSKHIVRQHQDEPEVQLAYAESTDAEERRRLLNIMKVRGFNLLGIVREARITYVRCLYCGLDVVNFFQHCLFVHSGETEVQEIINIKGNRNLKSGKINQLQDRCIKISWSELKRKCRYCGVFYSKKYLPKHIRICFLKDNSVTSTIVENPCDERKLSEVDAILGSLDVEYRCLADILANMKPDIIQVILNDRYLLELGKALLDADIVARNSKHTGIFIKLQSTVKLLRRVHENSGGTVDTLKRLFLVKNYRYFKRAVVCMLNYFMETRSVSKCLLPYRLGYLMMRISSVLRSIVIKEGDKAMACEIIRWKKLYRSDFYKSLCNVAKKQTGTSKGINLLKTGGCSTAKSKGEQCPFCCNSVKAFAKHITRVHAGEPEVRNLMSMTKGSREWKKCLASIKRRKSDTRGESKIPSDDITYDCLYCRKRVTRFFSHCKLDHSGEPEMIEILDLSEKKCERLQKYSVLRSLCRTFLKDPNEDRLCTHCRRPFGISTDSPVELCDCKILNSVNIKRRVVALEESLDDKFKCMARYLATMDQDDVNIIGNDSSLMEVGKYWLIDQTGTYRQAVTISRMKLTTLGKLLSKAVEISSGDVKSFRDIFFAKNFQYFLEILKFFCGYDNEKKTHRDYSTVKRIRSYVTEAQMRLSDVACQEGDKATQEEMENWMAMYNQEFGSKKTNILSVPKKFMCPFCHDIIEDNFYHHVKSKHSEIPEVNRFLSLPVDCKERVRMFQSWIRMNQSGRIDSNKTATPRMGTSRKLSRCCFCPQDVLSVKLMDHFEANHCLEPLVKKYLKFKCIKKLRNKMVRKCLLRCKKSGVIQESEAPDKNLFSDSDLETGIDECKKTETSCISVIEANSVDIKVPCVNDIETTSSTWHVEIPESLLSSLDNELRTALNRDKLLSEVVHFWLQEEGNSKLDVVLTRVETLGRFLLTAIDISQGNVKSFGDLFHKDNFSYFVMALAHAESNSNLNVNYPKGLSITKTLCSYMLQVLNWRLFVDKLDMPNENKEIHVRIWRALCLKFMDYLDKSTTGKRHSTKGRGVKGAKCGQSRTDGSFPHSESKTPSNNSGDSFTEASPNLKEPIDAAHLNSQATSSGNENYDLYKQISSGLSIEHAPKMHIVNKGVALSKIKAFSDRADCFYCLGKFNKNNLATHVMKICRSSPFVKVDQINEYTTISKSYFEANTDRRMISLLMGRKEDELSEIIRNSYLLLLVGQEWLEEKGTGAAALNVVRSGLRLLARLLMRASDCSGGAISKIEDLFLVKNFDFFIGATVYLGEYDWGTKTYAKPSLPSNIGYIMQRVVKKLEFLVVRENDANKITAINRWKELFDSDFKSAINHEANDGFRKGKKKLKCNIAKYDRSDETF